MEFIALDYTTLRVIWWLLLGILLAILLAAGVTFQQWLRFALGGYILMLVVGVAGILAARSVVSHPPMQARHHAKRQSLRW